MFIRNKSKREIAHNKTKYRQIWNVVVSFNDDRSVNDYDSDISSTIVANSVLDFRPPATISQKIH